MTVRGRPWPRMWIAALAMAIGFTPGHVLRADENADLASTATNPIGDMVQLQFQSLYSPSTWGMDGHSYAGIVQPVVPFDLPWKSMPKLITRTTIPYVGTPDLPGVGSKNGLGDTVVLAFGLPKLDAKGQMFGIGPALLLPTATEDETGTGKWAGGPASVYINMQTKGLMWGVMGYGLWDFAGDSDRGYVSQFNVQPVLNKYFDGGWYLGIQDLTWVYDGKANKWNLPMGPRLGRVTKIGDQAVNIFGGAYYNPVSSVGTSRWSFKLSLSLLFPE